MSTFVAEFEEVSPDEIPPVEPTDIGFHCEVCGVALEYSGRGRKPRFCADHKPGRKTGTKTTSTRNVAIASQAADILMTSNAFVGFLAMMGGLPSTADVIDTANPEFRERAYQALLSDPDLARSIARNGAMTGKMALIMAYSMFAFTVVPVAYSEIKERRSQRELE